MLIYSNDLNLNSLLKALNFITPGKNKSFTGLHAPGNIKYTRKNLFIPGLNQTFHALEKIIYFPKNYFFSPKSYNIICALKISNVPG